MKKLIKVIVILLIIGAIIGGIGIAIHVTSGGAMKNCVQKNEKVVFDGESISVDAVFDEIEIKIISGNEVTFDYFESEKVKRTIKKENGKISFETEAPHYVGIFNSKYYLKIGLPQEFSENLKIENKTGSVNVDLSGVTCKEIDIEVTTGSVTVKNAVCSGNFNVEVTTGGINVSNVSGENFSLEDTTGSLYVTDVWVVKNANLKTTTGSISVDNLSADSVKVKLTTGSLRKAVVDCKSFSAEATTGGLSFNIKSASQIVLKTTTGSINGKIVGNENDFNITSSTTTGKSNLTNQIVYGSDKELKASATTGSITVDFVE